ncbi:hypothetical protein PQX77_010939 [Marasmius sp. AFHP31]|nr:hypothetical protein PQX77_010939 [Marasmius sp. AFHP31]
MFNKDETARCESAFHNKNFFLPSATFRVGNQLFQLPKFVFPTSETFDKRYRVSDHPTVLSDCTPEQFEAFLTVLLQPLASIFPNSSLFPYDHPSHQPLKVETILSALDLATKWGFEETREELRDKAKYLINSASQKITLGKRYGLLAWFREGLEELVRSDEDIGLEDAEAIGMAFALRVYHARSRYARLRLAAVGEESAALDDRDSLNNAIEQVFANEIESFSVSPLNDTSQSVEEPATLHEDAMPPINTGNDSPSFVSVAAEISSSTVGSDTSTFESVDRNDYSTDEEFYTRPPSVFVEESVFGDSVLTEGSFVDETTATSFEEPTIGKADKLTVQPVASVADDDAATTPRPPIFEEESTTISSKNPPPVFRPLDFPSPPSPTAMPVVVTQVRPASAPPLKSPVKPSISAAHTTTSVTTAANATQDKSTIQPPPTKSPVAQVKASPPHLFVPPQVRPPTPAANKVSKGNTVSPSAPRRDDALVRDILRCVLDPQLPMPSRVAIGVPKTCNNVSSECNNSLRCDPCCLRQARNFQADGSVPKANTAKGQVFLDLHLRPNGANGMTTMAETLRYIPKKNCNKSSKNCGEKKRCQKCCENGVREMLEKGEII